MLNGYFFFYDIESSTAEKQLFRYNKVRRDLHPVYDWNDVAGNFPLYLTFEANRIVFNIDLDQRYGLENPTVDASHWHAKVLHLPITQWDNLNDGLSRRLMALFPEKLNLHPYTPVIIHNYESQDANKNCFVNPYDLLWEKTGAEDVEISKRELFLDFLFDFMHSSVFQQYKNFDDLEINLKEHYLWRAIACKCDYYYWRGMYEQETCQNADLRSKERMKFYSWELWKAEEKWLHCLRDDNSTLLYRCNGWFNKSLREIQAVLLQKNLLHGKENFAKEFRQDLKDLVERMFHRGTSQAFNRHVWLKKWYLDIAADPKSPITKTELHEQIRIAKDEMYLHLIGRFAITTSYNWAAQMSGLGWIFNASLAITIAVLLLFGFLFFGWSIGCSLLMTLILIGLVDMILMPIMMSVLGTLRHSPKWFPLNYHPNLAMPNMALAIMAGWLAYIPVSNEAWAMNVVLEPNLLALTWAFALVFTLTVTSYTIRNLTPEFSPMQAFRKAIFVFVKGFSLSLLCGVVTMHQLHHEPLSNLEFIPTQLHSVMKVRDEAKTESVVVTFEDSSLYRIFINDNLYIKGTWKHINLWTAEDSHYTRVDTIRGNYKSTAQTRVLTLAEAKPSLISTLKKDEGKEWIPSISLLYPIESYPIFIFPKLLITYAAIAFFLGFFIELAFQTRVFKGPV